MDKNQIVFAGPDQVGQLRRPREVNRAFGDLTHEFGRHFADGGDAGAPVMHPEQAGRHAGEHLGDLRRSHGRVRSERRQHVHQPVAKIIVNQPRENPGLGMKPGKIRRDHQHPAARPQPVHGLGDTYAQVLDCDFVGYRTTFKVKHNNTLV